MKAAISRLERSRLTDVTIPAIVRIATIEMIDPAMSTGIITSSRKMNGAQFSGPLAPPDCASVTMVKDSKGIGMRMLLIGADSSQPTLAYH
jgi:hypothetical protein